MQQAINHRFILARRRAQRLDHPVYESPAFVRKSLTPKVQIGILRDPAAPITIEPAIHTPARRVHTWFDRDTTVAVASLVGFVLIFTGVV